MNNTSFATAVVLEENIYSVLGVWEYLIMTITVTITGTLGAIGNGAVMVIFCKYPAIRANDCLYLIFCLAIVDFISGQLFYEDISVGYSSM